MADVITKSVVVAEPDTVYCVGYTPRTPGSVYLVSVEVKSSDLSQWRLGHHA